MKRAICCLALGCLALGAVRAAEAIKSDLVVSPDGNDANPETLEKPFATLGRTRDAVRELRKEDSSADLLAYIRGGMWLTEPVVFSLDDSSPHRKMFYSAYPGEQPIFSSGVPVGDWRKYEGDLPGLPDRAHGKVRVAELPGGLKRFTTLFDGDGLLPRARTKGFFPHGTGDCHTLYYPADAVRIWSNVKAAAIAVRPNYAWVMNILPVGSVNEAARVVRTPVPATFH